jgi:hypothetical protein
MLVNFYQTTEYNNPEDCRLHTHDCENLKSYKGLYESSVIFFSPPQKM